MDTDRVDEWIERLERTFTSAAHSLSVKAQKSVLADKPDQEARETLDALDYVFGNSISGGALLDHLRRVVQEQTAKPRPSAGPRDKGL